MLAHAYNNTIDCAVGSPGHGKDDSVVLNYINTNIFYQC